MSQVIRAGLKLSIAAILALWVAIWILKPTKLWKKSWHVAEDWAEATVLRESGLNVIVFCFPILAVAVLLYILAYLSSRERRIRQNTSPIARFSGPIIINSPIGILSSCELLAAALFIIFLAWTYYSNLASDLSKMAPSKILKLNRRQLRVMAAGVRFGSLSEACLALLLLPVLRGMSLFSIFGGVQFEASVRYHVWLGNGIMLFTILHSATIMSVWGEKNSLWTEITRWQSTGRVYLAGAIALLTMSIIWLSSLPPVRRTKFQLFYLTHHLYVVFIFFFLMHAGTGHFYLVFAGVLLFALDKFLRIIQSRHSTSVLSARVLACKAIELTLPKHPSVQYAPTSTIFVKIPSISTLQWHPFSITSSSNMDSDRLSVMIKCQGPWTSSLYEKIQSIQDTGSEGTRSLLVAVEGPYGPATFDYQRYDILLLVAGGSGITPFLSILQDVASSNRDNTNTCPTKIQLIYVVKKAVDLSMLTPISSLLLDWPPELGHLKLRVFVTREKDRSGNSVSEMLQEMSQVKAVILDQHSGGEYVPKLEGLSLKAAVAGLASIAFLVSLVCLTHFFIHREKRSSPNKTPSWISDILVICSFVIATSCGTTMAVILSMGRKDVHVPAVPQNKSKSAEMYSENVQNVWGEDEISFGKRPNLIDIVSELQNEQGKSEVGVYVCGPDSLQRSVASVCRACPQNHGRKNKLLLKFHSINFSL